METNKLARFAIRIKDIACHLVFGGMAFFSGGMAMSLQKYWPDWVGWVIAIVCLLIFVSGIVMVFFAAIIGTYAERLDNIKKLSKELGSHIANLERLKNLNDGQLRDIAVGELIWEGMIVKARADLEDAKNSINEEFERKKEIKNKLDEVIVPEPWAYHFCSKLFGFEEGR